MGVGAAMLLASVVPSKDGIAKTRPQDGVDENAALQLCLQHVAKTRGELKAINAEAYNLSKCALEPSPTVACLDPFLLISSSSTQARIERCIDSAGGVSGATKCIAEKPPVDDWLDSLGRSELPPLDHLTGVADGRDIYKGVKPNLNSALLLVGDLTPQQTHTQLKECLVVASTNNGALSKLRSFMLKLRSKVEPKVASANAQLTQIIKGASGKSLDSSGYYDLSDKPTSFGESINKDGR